MCKMRVIHKNTIGAVKFCHGCNNYQVQLGHMVTTVTEDELMAIKRIFSDIHMTEAMRTNPKKKVLIRTPLANLMFSYTLQEIGQVQSLLEMTAFLLQANSLIRSN